jgi:hypothetical protein
MRSQTTAAVPKRHIISGAEAAVLTASGRMQRPRDGRAESFAQAEWRTSLENKARTLAEVDVRLLVTARNIKCDGFSIQGPGQGSSADAQESRRGNSMYAHMFWTPRQGPWGQAKKGKETQRRESTASAKRKNQPWPAASHAVQICGGNWPGADTAVL